MSLPLPELSELRSMQVPVDRRLYPYNGIRVACISCNVDRQLSNVSQALRKIMF